MPDSESHYDETIDWLFSQIPNYQKEGRSAYKPGLDTIRRLLDRLNNPHKNLKTIHVAGTNGKGSVCHILAAALQSNGYRCGLFTSPHLIDFRERIKIKGEMISKEFVLNFVNQNKSTFLELEVSFFEISTAMAFTAFKESDCDIAIVETGLGGRLDSTNVLQPEISVITNVGLDHTEFLGKTIVEIAKEKAGIIKFNTPVVIGEQHHDSESLLRTVAESKNAEVIMAARERIESDLLGKYQQKNLNTACGCLNVLKKTGWALDDSLIQEGFKKIITTTGFRARMEKISDHPLTIFDAAHNPESVQSLMKEVDELDYDKLHVIFGASNDKDIEQMLRLLPRTTQLYLTRFDSERSASEAQLSSAGQNLNLSFELFKVPKFAVELARKSAGSKDLILVFGSFYLFEQLFEEFPTMH